MSEGQSTDFLEQGIRYYKSGNSSNALKLFSMAVQSDPRSARAWYWLGQVVAEPEKKAYCSERAKTLDPRIEVKESLTTSTDSSLEFEKFLNLSKSAVKPIENQMPESEGSPFVEDFTKTPVNFEKRESVEKPPSDYTEPTELINNQEQKNIPSEIPAESPIKKEKTSAQTKVIWLLVGLLISLVIFGISIRYLINSGFLDDYLSVPISIMGTETPLPTSSIPTPTPFRMPPTFTPTFTPYPTATPVIPIEMRIQTVAGDIHTAQDDIYAEDYADAIIILDKVIEKMPDYAKAYYMRGYSYLEMIDSLHIESEYIDYLTRAKEDLDRAISLDPNIGDYYLYRSYVLWDLAIALDFRQEREPLFQAALENILMVKKLGSTSNYVQMNEGQLYSYNGQCEEGANRLIKALEQYPNVDFRYAMHAELAKSYVCLRNYNAALEQINETITDETCNCDYRFEKAEILYALGQKEEALNLLNDSIEEHPGFQGYRYYLRSLIYLDQGKFDLAKEDIQTGMGNTWGRSATMYFVLSKLALEENDVEFAKQYLQYAEAAYFNDDSPVLIDLINQGMTDFNLEPLDLINELNVNIMPIPSNLLETWIPSSAQKALLSDQASNQGVLSEPWPSRYYESIEADFDTGLPATTLVPNEFRLFHLVPKEPVKVANVVSLNFYMLPDVDIPSPMKLELWTHSGDWNETYVVYGGDNPIEDPSLYIGKNGDFFIGMYNSDEIDSYSFETAGFIATVELEDGSLYTYGLTQSPLVLEWQNR